MSGRGRGRGALANWGVNRSGAVPSRVVASVPPLNNKVRNEMTLVRKECRDCSSRKNMEIMQIVDLEHFWARIGTFEEMEKFDRYLSALNAWCDQQPPVKHHLLAPAIGQLECVRHTHSGLWKRAQVTRQSDNSVDVFYLDDGEVESVPLSSLCSSTPSDITACPPQALEYALAGIQPVDEGWCQEAIKMFSDIVSSGHRLEAVELEDSGKVKIFVIDNERGEFSVGDILIQEGFAVEKEEHLETADKPSRPQFNSKSPEKHHVRLLDALLGPVEFARPGTQTRIQSKNPEGQTTARTHGSKMDNFAESRTSNFVSKSSNAKLNAPHPALSGRADSSSDWRADSSFESSQQRNKVHLASPQEFLTPATSQDASERGSLNPPTRWTPAGRGQPLNNTSHWNNEHQTAKPQAKSIGNFFKDSQEEQRPGESLWQSRRPMHREEFNSSEEQLNRSSPPVNFAPKDSSRGRAFGMDWGRESTYPQHPSQPQLLKTQPLSENTEDKTQKAELDWQVWKYQRSVKRILNRMTVENVHSFGSELEQLVADSRLSRNYQGVSEVLLLLQMIVDKAVDQASFGDLAVKACIILEDLAIPGLDRDLTKVVMEFRESLAGQLGLNNWQIKCQRFCTFLGKLFIASSTSSDNTSSLKPALDDLVNRSLHHWADLEQKDSEPEQQMSAVCLKYLLAIIGPILEDQAECSPLSDCFTLVREHVLSAHLSVDVKSTLLDLLLLRAASWSCDKDIHTEGENEAFESADDDDVVIEPDDNEAESAAAEQESDPGTEQLQDCDAYGEVKTMLDKLKLQHLFGKFQENCIRDSLLLADKEELKKTLQEAGFPPGVILEIRMYVDKGHINSSSEKTFAREQGGGEDSRKPENPTVKKAMKSPSPPPNVAHQSVKLSATQADKGKSDNRRLSQESGARTDQSGASNHEAKRDSPPKDQPVSQVSLYSGESRRQSGPVGLQSHSESNRAVFTCKDTSSPSRRTIASDDFKPNLSVAPASSGSSKSYSTVLKNASFNATEVKQSNGPAKQTSSSSRSPPGFSPLSTNKLDANMTVFSKKDSEKHADSMSSKVPINTREAPKGAREFPKSTREAPKSNRDVPMTSRQASAADTSKNWRWDRGQSAGFGSPPRAARNFVRGRGAYDQVADKPHRAFGPGRGSGQNAAPAPPRDTPGPPRPFGPGGPKACSVCGSREHLRCNDRSKMFFD